MYYSDFFNFDHYYHLNVITDFPLFREKTRDGRHSLVLNTLE